MGNMSYCRFENTARDLEDCLDAIHNGEHFELSSQYELDGFVRLVELAQKIWNLDIDVDEVIEQYED
jgi:hypothetical protein